jgi:PAS domain S-box-containing protein
MDAESREPARPSALAAVSRSVESRSMIWVSVAIIAAVLAVLATLAVVSRELEQTRESHAHVQRTREIIEGVQRVLLRLQDAETGERGFLITGEQAFLAPYEAAERSIDNELAALDEMIRNEEARRLLAALAVSVGEQMTFLRSVIAQHRGGDATGAAELIRQQSGKQKMDEIRSLVGQLEAYEQSLLAERLQLFEERSERSKALVQAALTAASLLVLVAGAALISYQRRRFVAEAAAQHALTMLSLTLDNISQGVVVFDRDQNTIAWNKRYLELRGVKPGQIWAGLHARELLQRAEPLNVAVKGVSLNTRDGALGLSDPTQPFDAEAVRRDGSVLEVRGRPLANGNFIVTLNDVTALKVSESAYRDQAVRLASILDNVVDAIITINESGSIESWSKGAERLFGYQAEEVLRRNVKMLMPEPHSSAHDGYLRRYMETGERRIIGTRREVEALHKDGRRVPVDLGISEMRIGSRRLFIGVVRDISERLEVERLKSGFVSTVSHELRTPLTSISGSLGLIAGGVAGELPAKAARLIDIAKLNSERLVRLINDILDLEKAESGRLEFHLEQQRLKPILQQAIESNRAYAHSYGATIELEPGSEDASVLVDRDRLIQVLTNLVSNAAKFSPRGGVVRVGARLEAEAVRIVVADEGPGVKPEFHARIFQKFAQADSSDSKTKGGTGLGLSIAKTMVERLGGSIGFDREARKGAAFHITLPIRREQHHPFVQSGAGTGRFNAPAVLVCEDDPDVAHLLGEMLRQEGLRAETVSTARAARAALAAVKFNVALIDLHLPDADGLEFINELRAHEHTRTLPIIVLTASSRGAQSATQVSALHLADWLQKPIDPERLLSAIQAVLARPSAGRSRILHVEDDASLTELVKELLADDADVVAANSLADARERLAADSYDLVILDIALGDGSGLDLLPLLRQSGRRRPPVILYSATEPTRELSQLVEAALVKSRDSVEQLLAAVRSLAHADRASTE